MTQPGVSTPGLKFRNFQNFVRFNKSLLFTNDKRDLESWPQAPAKTRSGGTSDSSPAIYRRAWEHIRACVPEGF
jgi:hypothetical protein